MFHILICIHLYVFTQFIDYMVYGIGYIVHKHKDPTMRFEGPRQGGFQKPRFVGSLLLRARLAKIDPEPKRPGNYILYSPARSSSKTLFFPVDDGHPA